MSWRRSTSSRRLARIERFERFLFRLIVVGVLLLVVVQVMLAGDTFRYYHSGTERLEGSPVSSGVELAAEGENSKPAALITFKLLDYAAAPKVNLMINNRTVASFTGAEVTVAVEHGDLLELDGAFYTHPLVFKVEGVSGPIAYPQPGQEFIVQQGITAIGRVEMAEAAAAP